MMEQNVVKALSRIPLFDGIPPEHITHERLGGLTNLIFKVGLQDRAYVLRIPGKGTEEYIDRRVEGHNACVAAEAGVSAEVLFFDENDGLMLCSYLDGCATMTPETFRAVKGAPTRAALALKRMHEFGKEFQFRFELFSMIDDYLGTLSKLGASLPDGYHDVVREAEAVRKVLDDNPMPLAPCHCDPLAENFLDNGERMWIVDWEYSGMNDPIWDLGDVSVEAGFTREHDEEMMKAYCGGKVDDTLFGRMVVYKAMCDLLWTLWGLIQHANKNPVDDFWAYSVNRFERCKTLMGSDSFGHHLAAADSLRHPRQ
ncbi:MAG: phosphotransferase family protein [Gammaproteobacteria bacterium]|nr:phosphotransferase family protein [Gammaproteobacteria bacterium]